MRIQPLFSVTQRLIDVNVLNEGLQNHKVTCLVADFLLRQYLHIALLWLRANIYEPE